MRMNGNLSPFWYQRIVVRHHHSRHTLAQPTMCNVNSAGEYCSIVYSAIHVLLLCWWWACPKDDSARLSPEQCPIYNASQNEKSESICGGRKGSKGEIKNFFHGILVPRTTSPAHMYLMCVPLKGCYRSIVGGGLICIYNFGITSQKQIYCSLG